MTIPRPPGAGMGRCEARRFECWMGRVRHPLASRVVFVAQAAQPEGGMTRRARIPPDQVAAFLDKSFAGRETQLQAISDDSGVEWMVTLMVRSLQAAGFKGNGRPEIQQACLRWAEKHSPYVRRRYGGGQ